MKTIFKSLLLAISYLTIFPVPLKKIASNSKAWNYYALFFPFCGWLIGSFTFIASFLIIKFNFNSFTPIICGLFFSALSYYLTKAMHLDGLCDCADALMAVVPKEKRQEILKDTLLGTGALCTGALAIIFKTTFAVIFFQLLLTKEANYLELFLLSAIIFTLPRTGVLLLATSIKQQRSNANSRNYPFFNLIISLFWSLPLIIFLPFKLLLTITIILTANVFFWRYKATKYFDKINGDVLGAYTESAEIITLLTIIYFLCN